MEAIERKPRVLIICTHFHSDRSYKSEVIFLQTMAGLHVASMVDVDKYNVKLYHESHDGPYDTNTLDDVDLVFLTGLQKDFDRMRQISYFFRRKGTKVVGGGNICTMFPEFACEFFDAVSVGGVECTLQVLEDFEQDTLKEIYRSPQTQLSDYVVKYELLVANNISTTVHFIEASRGCHFKCDFCVIPAEGANHITYRIKTVVDTIERAINTSPRWSFKRLFPFVFFIDNNFSSNIPHMTELCSYLKNSKRLRGWGGLVTQNIFKRRDLIEMIAKSGCRILFTGIESFDEKFLTKHNKVQNTHQSTSIFEDIKFAQSLGITVIYPYMFDPRLSSVSDMKKQVEMLTGLEDLAFPDFFTVVSPLAGTKLFWESASKGELLPNLRLRDLDGQTIAYRQMLGSCEEYSEFLRVLYSDPLRLTSRAKFYRNLVVKLSKTIHRPIAAFLLYWSSTSQVRDAGKTSQNRSRNYIGGQDILDPQYEHYPEDISAEDKARYFDPIQITDQEGNLQLWIQRYQPQSQSIHRETVVLQDSAAADPERKCSADIEWEKEAKIYP